MSDHIDPAWPAAFREAITRRVNGTVITAEPPIRPGGGRPAAAAPTTTELDYTVVRELQRQVSADLAPLLAKGTLEPSREQLERERATTRIVGAHVDQRRTAGEPLSPDHEHDLIQAVLAELAGLGRLHMLLSRTDIENITIKGHSGVRIERTDGGIEYLDAIADTDPDLIKKLQLLARNGGAGEKAFGDAWPMMSVQLGSGQRLAAVYGVTPEPVAVIRIPGTIGVTLDDLVNFDQISPDKSAMIDPLMRDFLRAAMRAHLNIMVAGVGGSGKTTLVRALADEIPASEWFVVMEEIPELGLHETGRHPWAVAMQARDGHGEKGPDGRPAGQIRLSDMIPVSLQLNARRLIVGEVRGREVGAMLQAMSTSNGSLSTIHARDPRIVFDRVVELALEDQDNASERRVYLQVANAMDLIVFVRIIDESNLGGTRHRFVSHIVEVDRIGDNGRPRTTTIFGPGPDGRGVPDNPPDRLAEALQLVGYDTAQLVQHRGQGQWGRPLDRKLRRRPS